MERSDDYVMRSAMVKILKEPIDSDETSVPVASYSTDRLRSVELVPCHFETDDGYEAYWRSRRSGALFYVAIWTRARHEHQIANFITEHGVNFPSAFVLDTSIAQPHTSLRQYYPDFELRDHGICIVHFALPQRPSSATPRATMERLRCRASTIHSCKLTRRHGCSN